jgi:hypothetical protein
MWCENTPDKTMNKERNLNLESILWGGLDMNLNLNKTKYLCIGETHSNLKLDKDSEIKSCQEYKYLGVIFDTSGRDDKEIRSRVIQARKCIACLNGILWSKDIRKERKLNIYNALIKSSLLYGSKHGDSQKIIRDGSKLQRWMP